VLHKRPNVSEELVGKSQLLSARYSLYDNIDREEKVRFLFLLYGLDYTESDIELHRWSTPRARRDEDSTPSILVPWIIVQIFKVKIEVVGIYSKELTRGMCVCSVIFASKSEAKLCYQGDVCSIHLYPVRRAEILHSFFQSPYAFISERVECLTHGTIVPGLLSDSECSL
jgi:hypothetical protein